MDEIESLSETIYELARDIKYTRAERVENIRAYLIRSRHVFDDYLLSNENKGVNE